MQPNADQSEAPEPVVPERPARPWRGLMSRREGPGGLTLGAFFVVEAICTGALLTAVLVAAS
jgi:hypothetical protein